MSIATLEEIKVIGDYSIIKQIGHGSLGTVFLAEHRFMKKHYILKVLPEEIADDRQFVQRFEEEISYLSTLEHPHLVKIHNVSFSGGIYFLVTDCVVDEAGETTNLAEFLLAKGERLDEAALFRIISQVADALDYAHGKKTAGKPLVHRGIKFSNLLVSYSQSKKQLDIKLSDFGLTRLIGSGAVLTRTYKTVAEALGLFPLVPSFGYLQERYPSQSIDGAKLTALHASFLQNFAFLAPEQKRPDKAASVDYRTDYYAVGILAYYLIVGEFPEGVFPMPSEIVPEFKYDWDRLVKSCLNPIQDERPVSLKQLLAEIQEGRKIAVKPEVAPVLYVQARPPEDLFVKAAVIEPVQIAVQPIHPMPQEVIQPQTVRTPQFDEPMRPIIQTAQIERPVPDEDPAAKLIVDPTVKKYTPELQEVANIEPIHTKMVTLRGGEFVRGSNDGNRDEMPCHHIHLNHFAIDIHPVSNEQFVRFLEVMGGEKDSSHHDIIRLRDSRIKRSGGKLSIESGYSKHPVVGVTWYGAVAYAKWVGKRLPTEAEWEAAARGGDEGSLFPTGKEIEKNQANFFSADTTPVMSYQPNSYGLYDMAGNVYEWCQDWYGYNAYEASMQEPDNPLGPLQGVYRVLRGGCWKSLKEDLRCSRRHRNNPGTVNSTYGFRCAADVEGING